MWRDLWEMVIRPPKPLSEETQSALADAYMRMSLSEQLENREAIVVLGLGVAPQLPWMIFERSAANLAKAEAEEAR